MIFEVPETRVCLHGQSLSPIMNRNYMYFIERGNCALENFVKKGEKLSDSKHKLVKGNYFGEISLLYNTPRTCTVTTIDYATLGKLN